MRPEPVDGLTFARASHRSPYGEIRSDWKREGDRFEWKVTVPPNTTATVFIPCTDPASLRESDEPISTSAGVRLETVKGGRAEVELNAGIYHFLSK